MYPTDDELRLLTSRFEASLASRENYRQKFARPPYPKAGTMQVSEERHVLDFESAEAAVIRAADDLQQALDRRDLQKRAAAVLKK